MKERPDKRSGEVDEGGEQNGADKIERPENVKIRFDTALPLYERALKSWG
jgi:hypothetical protein